MKIHVLSDLHIEADPSFKLPATDADVLVLAGDIANGVDGLAAFAGCGKPLVYVPGNHEYYERELEPAADELVRYARAAGVHLLDRAEAVIDGVRFIGATLWTDFRLDGEAAYARTLAVSRKHVLDFKLIRHRARMLEPEDTIDFHARDRAWLDARLAAPFAGTTVVVTHHAPHPLSVHPRWNGNPVNPAFVTDLTSLMGRAPLWIHGHTHDSFDYTVARTRVVCNPKGYLAENRAFEPAKVVTV